MPTFVQSSAFASSSSTVVICDRKSGSKYPGFPKGLSLACGFLRMTSKLTANAKTNNYVCILFILYYV